MDRKKFRQFLHENFKISDDVIMDRIFKYFNKNSTDDIDHEEWVVGFNIFLKGTLKPLTPLITLTNFDKGTDEELVRFCFDTYDLNDDGYISREEMLLLLKDCMYKNSRETNEEDGDDGVKDLIEMTMRKMDQDRDGRVSYSDFWETVQEVR